VAHTDYKGDAGKQDVINTQWAEFVSFGECDIELVRFEVLIAVTMKCTSFWDVVLCSLIEVH
jgi:hypothetical protein